ncbi:MAG: hypothetical protein ACT4QG_00960 [Sporichthyaceae bacterium]
MTAMLAQCTLTQGPWTLVSWLDTAKRFRVGNRVTLKGLDGLWTIEKVGHPIPADTINRGWNNNI